jgi:hypothetical protein
MPQLAEKSGIAVRTLHTWRYRFQSDPGWELYGKRKLTRRVFSDDEEKYLAEFLRETFVRKFRYCPPRLVNQIARCYKRRLAAGFTDLLDEDGQPLTGFAREVEVEESEEQDDVDDAELSDGLDQDLGLGDEEDEVTDWEALADDESSNEEPALGPRKRRIGPKRPGFWASNRWRRNFLKRRHLSLRKLHPKRRTAPDDEVIAQFLGQFEEALATYRPDRIFNMDETSWKFLNNGKLTLADTGTEGVHCHFSTDPKECVTAIATISAAGERMPLWVIAKGTTVRSEQKFQRLEASQQLHLTHSENGWTNGVVAKEDLKWLRQKNGHAPICLLWDVFSAHRDTEVKDLAAELDIQLIFIPAGQTDTFQPLDVGIFGPMKQRAREEFDALIGEDFSANPGMGQAMTIMVDVWGRFQQDEILGAWDHLTQI